jgi:Dna[CI] antecedent, DciA
MPARKINFYIDTSDSLRKLASDARRLAELQQILLGATPPPLAQACCVKKLSAGTLHLAAENGAIASKIRQLAPRLLVAYQNCGVEVTSIRVEVQVNEGQIAPLNSPTKVPLSIDSINNLEILANRLEASPLKRALTNMVDGQRKK